MALDHLSHVHQLTEQAGGPRRGLAGERVRCLGCRQVMADRADPADARGDLRHLEIQAAFAEFFEAAEFIDMHVRTANTAILQHVDGHLGVAFDTGNGLNCNFLCHSVLQ